MRNIDKKIRKIFEGFETPPILFVGAGLSRRYLGLGNWEKLLRDMAVLTKENELAFEMYRRKAINEGFQVGEYQKIAELIERDLSDVWFEQDRFKESRDEYKELAIQGVSPLKIEIGKYIKENSKCTVKEYENEIESFKRLGEKSIAGVITTNYDEFIERVLGNYTTYIGQEELIFSNIQGVGEIYKIHGCCTEPGTIVIDEKDYIDFEEKNAYLAAKILTIFLEHPIIFLGYSISDPNIKGILKAIVKCLSKEKLEQFKERLIFIQWNGEEKEDEIKSSEILFDDEKTLEMTSILLKDYSILYEALLNNKFRYKTSVLRRLKEEIYDLVLTNEPTTKMKVVGIDDDSNLDNVEFVVGVGVMSEFGQKGYSGLKVEEIIEDVLFDNKDYDSNFVVTASLPMVLAHNGGSIPIYKYVSSSEVELPMKVKKEIKTEYKNLLNKTILDDNRRIRFKNSTIKDIRLKNETDKALELIHFLQEENIEIEELGDFLREYYTDNPNLLSGGKAANKTNFRRLVKIYDWLKYYKKYKEKES
ncbi:MAG: SIR2 family protein [Clostridium sp.]